MLSTNRILLFVATVILCGLLFGLELGLILLITAIVCFNSYEPFSNGNDLECLEEDELEEECKLHEGESKSSINSNAVSTKTKVKKMSLWQPRKSAAASVKIAKPDPNSPKRLSNINSPSPRPPLRYTGSPFGKSTLRPDNTVNEDRENTSLWGNPYSPTAKRKSTRHPQQSNTSAAPLLSSPFLPRVKRAIGVGEAAVLKQQSNSPRRSNYGMSGGRVFSPQHKALPYPSASSPGLMPLVRLGRHEKPILNENNSNMVHSPVTVKIAAPSPRRLNYTSRLSLSQEDREAVTRKAPDKETVLSALRDKSRKRGIPTQDESISEVNDQQSKRRKQDDPPSSSSSMVSEPEFLAELPVNGYSNIPLHMVGMKRPATPTVDVDLQVTASVDRIIKKAKKDTKNNPIVSSLSSSRRGMAKEMKEFQRGEKRKPEEANQSFEREPVNKQTRKDIQLSACSLASTPVPEIRPQPHIPERSKILTDTPSQTVTPVTEEIKPPQSLKKKILCNAEQASQKVKKGVDMDFLSPRSKQVMSLDVTTNPEDYDRDPAAVRQRAVDMLADITGEVNPSSDKDKVKTGNGFTVENGQPTSLRLVSSSESQLTITTITTTAATAITTTSTTQGSSAPITLTALLNTDDKTSAASSSGGLLSSVLFSSSSSSSSSSATATTAPQLATSTAQVSSMSATASTTTATVQNDAASQFSFKPVFPVASTPATASSQQGANTSSFTFGGAKTTATTASTLASATITAPAAGSTTVTAVSASVAPSGFSFGSAAASVAISQAPLKSSLETAPSTGNPQHTTVAFTFGAASQPSTASTPAATTTTSNTTDAPTSGFSFGGASDAAKPSAAAAPFAFGQAPTSMPAATTQSSSVGFSAFQSTSTTATTTNSSLFSFGSTQKPAGTTTTASGLSTGGFGIATPATTAQVSGFGVSTPAGSQLSSGFTFGQTQPSTTRSLQNTASNTPTMGFAFGAISTTTTQSSTQPSSGLFSFGSATASNPTPATGLGFGSNPTPAQPSSSNGFNFTAAASTASPFAQSTSKGSIFGVVTTTSQSSTGAPTFGSQPASTAAATSSVFGTSSGNFSFGQNTAPAFGQTSSAAPLTGFGKSATTTTTTASSAFQFGATNSAAQSSFGSSAPGFTFGASSNNASSTGSAFGSKPSSSLPVPTFGQSSGSAFGSFGNQQSTSMFGGTQSQSTGSAPSFGQASSTSAFGNSNQAPFNFGQAGNPAPATPAKGFDFSAAASGTPSLQFGSSGNQASGFSTPNQKTPVMNFGSVTPGASTPAFGSSGFGAPAGGMFSVGSGTTAPRPRSRARRKGTKR